MSEIERLERVMKATRYAIRVVIIHALVSLLHGAAHRRLNVPLSVAQNLYVVVVIFFAPLVAALLLSRKQQLSGALLLLGSMAGSLVFGVYNHYIVRSPDHVAHVGLAADATWATIFQVTAAALVGVEVFGCQVGTRLLRLYTGVSRLTA